MRWSWTCLLALLLALCYLSQLVVCQDDDDLDVTEEQPEETTQQQEGGTQVFRGESHPFVYVNYAIVDEAPETVTGEIPVPIGEKLVFLAGFVNEADVPINVTGIAGTVHDPLDHSKVYANLTGTIYYTLVQPGDEYTFEYFVATKDTRDGTKTDIMLSIYYSDPQQNYRNVFFNRTVEFVDSPNAFDTQQLAVMVLAAVALVAVALYASMKGLNSSKSSVEYGTSSSYNLKDGWEESYAGNVGKTRRRGKK